MSLRRVIFWIHLAVGATAALVILMTAVTGVILTYEAQLNRWALRGYLADTPAAGATPLGIDALIDRVTAPNPDVVITSLALKRDAREPALVRLDTGNATYVDRYTGALLGDGDTRMRRFLRSVMYWHRWFALEGEYRIVGRTFVATANLGFLFLILSGLYLWWPPTRGRGAWRQALWLRRGLAGRARDFNRHRAIGFWSAVPLAVIVASGATISYQWAADLVHRLAGEAPPPLSAPPSVEPAARGAAAAAPNAPAPPLELQALAARAAAETPGWRTLTIDLAESPQDAVVVAVDRGSGRQPSLIEDLVFDRTTGELVGRGGYPTFSPGFKARRWLRFAHTGEVYGVIGQTIAGAASLGAAWMVWTGLAMSWRRFFGSG